MRKAHYVIVPMLAVLYAGNSYGQAQQKLSIDAATVFLSGAELTSTAKLSLAKGENEILFTNVAGNVNSASLTINASNGVVVEAATFQNNFLASETLSPKAKEIKDSIDLLGNNVKLLGNKIAVLNTQIGVFQDNKKISGENTGLNVAELNKMLELIASKMEGLMNQRTDVEEKKKKTEERIDKLKKQLDEEQKKDYQPGGQLLVKFYAKEATTTSVSVDYIVPGAGWTPTYDIMAEDAHSPVKLFYKANIYQNSGVTWNNVRLSLSTGNPNEGAQAPVMNPWYLSFYIPQTYNNYMNQAQAPMAAGAQMLRKGYTKSEVVEDKVAETSMNQYVAVDNSGISTSFDIELPYTIPSDGQQHLVAIKKYELPATYRYYAAPKMDRDAFLQAQITGWEDMNLLSGTTNIFYEGTYVGQGAIDVRNVHDTMTISLGRDKKVVVRRERDVKLRSVKTIGSNIRETFAYTISVRNARKEPITLILQDQFPVSNDKDIVVEDKDGAGGEYDETTGMLKWPLQVNSSETKKISFGYTIKYPKGKSVSGLR